MALRRPPAPRLRTDGPGPPHTSHAPEALPAQAPDPAGADPSAGGGRRADRSVGGGRRADRGGRHVDRGTRRVERGGTQVDRGVRRRTMLVVGTAAVAVTGIVSGGALLTRRGGRSLVSTRRDPASNPFTDVADDDADLEAMVWADDVGVLPARAGGAFAPGAAVARGDLALALHRLAGTPAVPDDLPPLIVDLGEAPDQAAALLWLHGRGALWGDADLKVHPEQPVTLADASRLLTALLRPALAAAGATWDAAAGSSRTDVAWLRAAGIASASAGDDGSDDAGVTRADLAGALHRANTVIVDALD